MKKILFLAYSIDNRKFADGIQSKRLITELKKHFEVKVYGRKFIKKTNNTFNNQLILSPNLYFLEIILYKLLKFLYPIFGIDKLLWSLIAYQRIKKEDNVDFIVVTHEPYSLFFLSRKLKKQFNRPLITLLFDPLVDNNMYLTSKLSNKIKRKYEKKIIDQSDYLFVYTKILFDNFTLRYPDFKNKIKKLNFCSEEKKYISLNRNDKVTIIHAGNLAGSRNLTFLVSAITQLKHEYKFQLSDVLQIVFYGGYRPQDKLLLKSNDVADVIQLRGFLTKNELYEEERKADALLIIDSLSSNKNVFFPSKLTEYFMFDKIIFAITPAVSATREWLEKSGHLCFSEVDIQNLIDSIDKLLNNRHHFDDKFDKSLFYYFTPKNVVKDFLKNINEL